MGDMATLYERYLIDRTDVELSSVPNTNSCLSTLKKKHKNEIEPSQTHVSVHLARILSQHWYGNLPNWTRVSPYDIHIPIVQDSDKGGKEEWKKLTVLFSTVYHSQATNVTNNKGEECFKSGIKSQS